MHAAKKKVLISLAWDDRKEEKWLFWLEQKLRALNFDVSVTSLFSAAATPAEINKIDTWLPHLQDTYGISPENTHLVEHDPGCLTILKYLERISRAEKPDPMMLVAGKPVSASVQNFSSEPATQKRLASGDKSLSLFRSNNMQVKLVIIYSGIIPESLGPVPGKKLLGR